MLKTDLYSAIKSEDSGKEDCNKKSEKEMDWRNKRGHRLVLGKSTRVQWSRI